MRTTSADTEKRRLRRRRRIRRRMEGTSERPRVSVFRSSKYLYAQVIDDVKGVTLASVSTKEPTLKEDLVASSGKERKSSEETGSFSLSTKSVTAARHAGLELGKRLKALGVNQAVFDRSGYKFTGRVKAIADGVRESGLIV
jgi:large subunit ribosomal protein L18